MPATSSVCEAPLCTLAPSGMRSRTIRVASAASAARVFSSRSGLTRRVDRLVDEGLVRRATAHPDARGVVVALTDAGVARLMEAAPIHLRGVHDLFVSRLSDQELAVLESALEKVT